jgi:hypothetical protein
MMLNSNMIARRAVVAPTGARPAQTVLPGRTLVIRRFKEDDNQLDDFTGQGLKTPTNPVTGDRLTPVADPRKEGYQATQGIPQGLNASARVLDQLDAKPEGRPFGELQAFDGLAPEVINSRLAMLGFAIAAAFELFQGKDVFEQIKAYPLLTVATFVAFTVASWIPFLRGQSYNVKSGPFTPAAEVTNGRIAMIGFVGLILFEAYFKGPFFPHLF